MMNSYSRHILLLGCFLPILIFAQPKDYQVFTALGGEQTGIAFQNKIQESNTVNYFKYEYLYNGGGVAVGDVNNDGLPDIYFTGNMTPNRLYLNKGDLKFVDVTSKAKASYLNDWCTGVTMVDINQDGWLDIYVSASGYYENPEVRRNILFVNDGNAKENGGIPTFTERAGEYGINDIGYSIQSVFFDYDNDGDLDLYVANHPSLFRENARVFLKKAQNPPYNHSDRLYRNDTKDGVIKFKDVSIESGIANYVHTLGVVVSDFDKDGWTDIYISNDYQEADILYKNTGGGSFVNVLDEAMKHTAKFSMGVDASDVNNDGWSDIFAVEMMAEDNKRQKTNMAPMDQAEFWTMVETGFGFQYMHNALQLNNGVLNEKDNQIPLTFSEVSYLSGIATTDWSWCPLFADFDNDGWKDLFVTNGYRRDVLDKDFTKKLKKTLSTGKVQYLDIADDIPSSKIPNYIFKNNGDLTFSKKSTEWGFEQPINSNGAAYADLDLDGDLDLIVNNMDTLALIYRNNTIEQQSDKTNFIRIKLANTLSKATTLGAKVTLTTADGNQQYQEFIITRGYQSSVEPILHFGLGHHKVVDKITVNWANGTSSTMTNTVANQMITITPETATTPSAITQNTATIFQHANKKYGVTHQHKERKKDDYGKQVLLPHKLSQNGPGLAIGDVTGDGLEDFYVGGSAEFSGELWVQQANGTFQLKTVAAFEAHRKYEDMGAVFMNINGDSYLDLVVVSGSYEFEEADNLFLKRAYLNDGTGNFNYKQDILPDMPSSGSCVVAGDYDKDGDLDLFIGGRVQPSKYPMTPQSYLLENVDGIYKKVTTNIAPQLAKVGMVTSALWTDYDNDEDLDLIVVGEWMPITIFTNEKGKFEAPITIPNSTGWWNSVTGGDFDNDGDMDYVLGNLGLNSKNKATPDLPFHIYSKDFDENGNFDIVLGYYYDGVQYPVRGLQCSSEQIPAIKKKIQTYDVFGSSTLAEIYGEDNLNESLHFEATNFASSYLKNNGRGQFDLEALPVEAQIAPIYGTVVEDFNQDGILDILAVGNQYNVEIETGRYDGMKGLLLQGDGQHDFDAINSVQSGFYVDKDAKALGLIKLGQAGKYAVLATSNNDKTLLFEIKSSNFKLNTKNTVSSTISRKVEQYIGSGYLSQ